MFISNYTPTYNTPVKFTGYKSVFSKKLLQVASKGNADDADKIFLTRQIEKFIDKKMKPERNIGEGYHGKVFKIDDKFVLKISSNSLISEDLLNLVKPKFSKLKTYFGEPRLEFYKTSILPNVSSNSKHIPAGIPAKYLKENTDYKCQIYYENEYLPLFSNLPQKSYDAIAKDCNTLNKMGLNDEHYSFDFLNPNNFVLVGKTLRITDDIEKSYTKNPNTVADLLFVFISQAAYDLESFYSKKAEPYRRELLKKIVLSGMKYNLPLGDTAGKRKIWQYVTGNLCKAKEYHLHIIDALKKMQKEIPDTKTRLKKASEYMDGIYTSKEIYGFGKVD